MEEQKLQYLEKIGYAFMTNGIKSMTMDDISKMLNISKKTLYKYFKDKDDIVCTLMKMDCEQDKCEFENAFETASNAIEEIRKTTEIVSEKLKEINPSVMYDLEKYHPNAWEIFNVHKRVEIFQSFKNNLERGISEGLYRESLNTDIIAKLFSEKIELVLNTQLFPIKEYKFEKVYQEMISYHLKGIVSEKGYDYLINNKVKID